MNLGIETSALQVAAKLTIVLAGAWLAHAALSRQNLRWRMWVWRVATVGVTTLLIAAVLPPLYGVPLPHPVGDPLEAQTGLAIGGEGVADPALERASATGGQPRAVSAPTAFGSKGRARAPASAPGSARSPVAARRRVASERIVSHAGAGREAPAAAEDRAGSPSGWRSGCLAGYGVVLCVLLVRLAAGLFTARRAGMAAVPPPSWVQAIIEELARNSRCPAVPVRVTDRFESPVLIGVLRPVILLPEPMLGSPSAKADVRGVILHEAAHVAGHDLLWDLVIAVVSAFLWPHPLAWRARAAHRTACERVSDRVAVDMLGDVRAYENLLARIALRVSGARSSFGLAMARRAAVRGRLAALDRGPGVPRLGHRAAGIAACVTAAVIALGVGSLVPASGGGTPAEPPLAETAPDGGREREAGPRPGERSARSRPQSLRLTVLRSDDGQPLPNARITVRMYGEKPHVKRDLTTDANGEATFLYPDGHRPVYLWATVHHAGFVPYYVGFGRNLIPAALPTEKTIRMDRGKKVGGTVVDPEGNPVAGAQLSITVPATDTPSEIHYHLLHEKTPADGTWLLDGAPLALAGLSIRVEHPRFIKSWHPVQDRVDGRYVLDPGVTLSGRVTDRRGRPVPGAHITVGRDRWGSLDKPVPVAEDGTYTVFALRPQSTWVTAEAPGFAPQVKPVELDGRTQPLDFQLAPGHTTRFKVVDSAGRPLAGVRIVADTWNGFRSLWWQAKTDASGLASWNGAPPDAVEFHLLGAGYAARRDVLAAPQQEPHLVELRRPLRIRGTVTGANGKEVPEFHVELGRRFPGRNEISWISHESSTGRNGRFEISYDEVCDEIYLRIEAAGLRPWTSEAIPFGDSERDLSVKLEAGSGLAGTVWSPDGQPAGGARLTLVTESQGMQFIRGYRPMGGKQTVVSDQQGRFEFLPVEETSLIVAVHDNGYAEVAGAEVARAGGIRLQTWARIEVIVRRAGKPLAGAKVAVNPQWQRRQVVRVFSYGISGTTDAGGRVTFDRIVPRDAFVNKTIEQPIGRGVMVYPERSAKVPLAPGQTAQVELGGSGVAVIGRLSVAGQPPARHQWNLNEALTLSTAGESGADSRKYYRALIGKDGSFRVEDIPPGRYQLRVDLTAVPDPNLCGPGARIGRIVREIDVSGDDPTVDLGVIEGSWFERLGAGDPAPLFAAQGIDGEPVRMAELRGRLVLLDFWATWCGPCLADMPKLAALRNEFTGDERFRILGLSLDNSIEEAAATVEKNGWPWTFAFAGPGTSAVIPSRYEVQSIPEKFLVDTDGTILYRGRDSDEIAQLVRKRLAELPAGTATVPGSAAGARPVKIDDAFEPGRPVALAMAMDNMDYQLGSEPSLKGPGLMLWSEAGTAIRAIEGVGTSAWLTGPKRLAIDPQRQRLYCCDTLHHRLVALDRFGRQLFATQVPDLHAAAVDERTGDVWCLALRRLGSGELLVLDSSGREKTRYPLAAFGLAYSPVDDAFWMVGKTIAKVSRHGKVLASHPLPEGAYTFTDVAADRQQGGAWVLEADHPDLPRSERQLWKVSRDGTAAAVHRFRERTIPLALACVDGKPWLTAMRNAPADSTADRDWEIQRFESDGTPSRPIEIPASDIAVGTGTGTIWLRTSQSILRIDRDGNTRLTISLPADCQGVQIAAF